MGRGLSGLFSHRCPYCLGKKVRGKKALPCCLCHGVGTLPVEGSDLMTYETLLTALHQLTSPSCWEASTREVFAIAKRIGYAGTFDSAAHILSSLWRQGYVTKRRFNSETMWSLSKSGAET
ncbi:MAG: hypothetical protein WAO19_10920 [Candidatus Kryptoniota bacterium]